jgi:phage shock protein PspC (stress-responsive transcriptional regulator)
MKKLYRSKNNGIICGVCAGLGDYFDIDPTFIRVCMVFFAVITALFPMIVAYLIAVFLIPREIL